MRWPAGDAGEEVFAAIGDDWDIEERTRAQLDRLGLGHIGHGHGRCAPSPAERWSRSGWPAQLLRRPDVLLLDEPTNNLDRDARARLYDALDDCRRLPAAGQPRPGAARPDGPHRRADRGEITLYGGNFHRVRGGRRRCRAGRPKQTVRQRRAAGGRREKRQTSAGPRTRRPARRRGPAQRCPTPGIPKILAGAMKRRAQEIGRAHRRRARPAASTTPAPGSTRPNARYATTTPSSWTCRTPRCRRAGRWCASTDVRLRAVGGSCSPATVT